MMPNFEVPNLTDSQKFNAEIYRALTAINTSLNILQSRQEKHHTILLEGENGDLPLTARMTNAEAFITEVRYWMKFLVGVVVVNLVSSTVVIVGALLKLIP